MQKNYILLLVTILFLGFTAKAQYTLQDSDVTIVNGEITACSYNFAETDIIIPETLQGQSVDSIANGSYNNGIFQNKGITDISMPIMDGLEMSKEIRRVDEDTPIIINSAFSDVALFIRAIKVGISDYTLKPTDAEQLIESIYKNSKYT